MFTKARIKLTAWYLVIIMIISLTFSTIIYHGVTREIERGFRAQQMRIEQRGFFPPRIVVIDPDLMTEVRMRIKLDLLLVNLIILGISGAAGYFLSGRTLKPIKEMVEKQNRFVADASHELRTPLTAMKAEIEVNLRDKELNLLGAKDLLKSNLEEVNNLSRLADGLIRLTAYDKGMNNGVNEKVSLEKISKEAVKKVAALAKKKKMVVEREVGEVSLRGSEQMLLELLVILLDNAIKFSRAKTRVILRGKGVDGSVIISVTDEGVGIREADLGHLFDRFYRSDKSRTRAGAPGYGLGLAIAKEIVERHNGTITITSKENKGSTFTIKLPL